jgi:hypothetical protein
MNYFGLGLTVVSLAILSHVKTNVQRKQDPEDDAVYSIMVSLSPLSIDGQ